MSLNKNQEIKKYVEDNKQRFLDELFELLRFPSVSADPKYKGDVLKTADFVAQKLNKKPSDLKFSIINGNQNVIEELNKYPNKIGVIGLNTISRPYDKKSEELRNLIKILPVQEKGQTFDINPNNLEKMTYPFTRVLYFLVNENGFNMASGFIRFSCTQIGQKIVEKEGLQPYNVYKREVQMR